MSVAIASSPSSKTRKELNNLLSLNDSRINPASLGVFSTSSIAWSGALSYGGYANNVSRITENVVRRFLDPKPF